MEKPLDLLQGTLDMLILKAVLSAPCTATASSFASSKYPKTASKSSKARCIPRCIASNIRAGSPASGANPKTTAKPNSTASPRQGSVASKPSRKKWNQMTDVIAGILGTKPEEV